MSKTGGPHGGGIFNTSKIKSKNRYGLNRKYKDKDRNKKDAGIIFNDGITFRSKCKGSDVSFGYKTLKEMKEAA